MAYYCVPQDFLFHYLYQQAQVNTVGPSGASHSAAPGVNGHGEGYHTSADSGITYNL